MIIFKLNRQVAQGYGGRKVDMKGTGNVITQSHTGMGGTVVRPDKNIYIPVMEIKAIHARSLRLNGYNPNSQCNLNLNREKAMFL